MGVLVREKPKDSNIWWILISYKGQRKSIKIGLNKKHLAEKIQDKIIEAIILNRLNLKTEPVDINKLLKGSHKECLYCWIYKQLNYYLANIHKEIVKLEEGRKSVGYLTSEEIRELGKEWKGAGYISRYKLRFVERKFLSDVYIKQLLMQQGFKKEDIKDEEIQIKRINLLMKRNLSKLKEEANELFGN